MPRAPRVASALAGLVLALLSSAAPTSAPTARAIEIDRSARLERAATDSHLQPWQREFFRDRLQAARAGAGPAASERALDSTADLPIWSTLAETPRRQGHSLVWDAATGRLLAFGGRNGDRLYDTVYYLEPGGARAWHRLTVAGVPPAPRMGQTATLDPAHHRLLVYGGIDADGSYLADLWALDLDGAPSWLRLEPVGPQPVARANHFAVVDSAHARLLVFGGANGGFDGLADLWALSLDGDPAWTSLGPATTFPGFAARAMLVDAGRHRLVLPGVLTVNYSTSWVLGFLSLDSPAPGWTQQTAPYQNQPTTSTGTPLDFAIDVAGDRLVCAYNDYYSYAYALPLAGSPSQWTLTSATGSVPPTRYGRASAADPAGRRLFVAGGGPYSGSYSGRTVSDVSVLDLAGMAQWTAVSGEPSPRVGHSMAIDPVRRVVHLFGGSADSLGTGYSNALTNSGWQLPLAEADPAWSPEAFSGGPLLPRRDASLVVDPVRDRLLLFGGTNGNVMTNEVWQRPLSGGTAWTRLVVGGMLPRQRANAAAVYDPDGDRLLVFGGYDYSTSTSAYLADLWALSLADPPHWTRLDAPGPAPIGRADAVLAYDSARHCAWLVGGRNGTYYYSGGLQTGEVWKLSLSPAPAWQQISRGLPNSGYGDGTVCSAFYDPAEGKLVQLVDAYTYPSESLGLYALAPSADTSWTARAASGSPPPVTADARGVFDPDSRRLVWFGGIATGQEGTWALSLGSPPLDVSPVAGAPMAALQVYPNPARTAFVARFSMPAAGRVTFELLDVGGRMVRGPVVADLPAGNAELKLGDLGSVRPGVYFARLHGALERRTRLAVVH